MNKQVKYGYLYGPRLIIKDWPIAASQNFENDSGKYVILDASDNVEIADSGDTQIEGWAELGDFTSSATAGVDLCSVDVSCLAVFGMPADADPANTRGETCDLIVNSGNQQADVGESTEDVIKIFDFDTTNDLVAVSVNPTKAYAAGVV